MNTMSVPFNNRYYDSGSSRIVYYQTETGIFIEDSLYFGDSPSFNSLDTFRKMDNF